MKNRKPWNVLVFPGGTENGLEINKSLRYAKEVILFSASSGVKNHAELMYENHFVIPEVKNETCLIELNEIIRANSIDFVFPANSLVIDFLIKNRSCLGCRVVLPENNSVIISRSKTATYKLFENKINIPRTYKNINEIEKYPVFIKPDALYGSQGVMKINSVEQFENINIDLKNYIISDYLSGEEFTIECFASKKNGLMYSMARTRERIRMGTSMRSEKANKEIQKETEIVAKIIQATLKFDGLWFFQMKFDENNILKLLEIETRVAGTMAFSRCLGANLPLANLYLIEGINVKINPQKFDIIIDRSLANRYITNIEYDTVYVDLDHTIILDEKLNLDLIKFIYQCINREIRIILISKSITKNKIKYLKKFKIYQLFDEIIWLNENDSKADYIINKNSIFIDDSFSQRLEVEDKLGISTFEPNMIEVLLNEKTK